MFAVIGSEYKPAGFGTCICISAIYDKNAGLQIIASISDTSPKLAYRTLVSENWSGWKTINHS